MWERAGLETGEMLSPNVLRKITTATAAPLDVSNQFFYRVPTTAFFCLWSDQSCVAYLSVKESIN